MALRDITKLQHTEVHTRLCTKTKDQGLVSRESTCCTREALGPVCSTK